MKLTLRRVFILLAIVVGVAAFITVGQIINRWQPRPPEAPEGWLIVRPPHDVSALVIDGATLWAGGRDGVYAVDRKTGAIIDKPEPDFPLEYVQALLLDEAGAILIGHSTGLTTYDGTHWRTYTVDDGLPSNRVNALLIDGESHIWAGTDLGVAIHDGTKWETPISADDLIDHSVDVMLLDSGGGIWFGSQSAPRGGSSYHAEGIWQHFSTEDGLPHNQINALFETSSGSVWAATGLFERGGACRFEREGAGWIIAETLTSDDGLAGERVRSVFEDRDGVLWFGSEYDGLARFDGRNWSVLTKDDGLPAMEVKVMLQDIDGNLWLGTSDGLTRIIPKALEEIKADS